MGIISLCCLYLFWSMKLGLIGFIFSLLLGFLILFIYLLLGSYQSAFEADQACHADRYTLYNDNKLTGCDHDLETNQWILYQSMENHLPAKVVKRYKY